jgi:thiosulfate dehydrogenase [quinone] large subunit
MVLSRIAGAFNTGHHVNDPPIAKALFANTGAAWFWLLIRLYVGYEWFEAGLHKFTDPKWMVDGSSLLGYWTRAVAIPAAPARPLITYDWYRSFLQFLIDQNTVVWFAKLIVFGELAIGVGMIVGAFGGIAAFFGALMNMSFMLAGTTSTNPILFLLGVGLMLAWKVAGWYGLDRVLLPMVGTPWKAAPILAEEPVGATVQRAI